MLTIATSITEDYFEKSFSFFDSINKNFKGDRKVCFCLGFKREIEGWETIEVPLNKIHCQWKPENRENYYSLQHGEFVKYCYWRNDEIVLFLDSDMILQREYNPMLVIPENTFLVSRSSYPPTFLTDVVLNLKAKISPEHFLYKYNLDKEETEFCAAFLIAPIKQWIDLYNQVKFVYKDFLNDFTHHAAWQLLINVVIKKNFKTWNLQPVLQNAEWYSGSSTKVIDDQLVVYNKYSGDYQEVVYFNHTKFNRNFKY